MNINIKGIVHLIFELGILKFVDRNGWKRAGVKDRESVAEHSLRAAQIGYMLAKMEGANAEKVACILMIHDMPEARVGDPDWISKKYIDSDKGLLHAINDQLNPVGDEIRCPLLDYYDEFEAKITKEGIIAKDADLLEMAFQGKEYFDIGHLACKPWLDDVGRRLQTESARELYEEMLAGKFTDWWLK